MHDTLVTPAHDAALLKVLIQLIHHQNGFLSGDKIAIPFFSKNRRLVMQQRKKN